ncbi:hypothetical protein BS78_05G027300 [Paspalum vaginatum]|nr:hypothetical protein BS78_05G027300 [Paspalum vaginatum]
MVWDPITGEQRKLPLLPSRYPRSWNAAVLCASPAGTCDHLDCHRGPFLVVLVGMDQSGTLSYVYSSETAAWSEGPSVLLPQYPGYMMPSVLSGNTLYFLLWRSSGIVKYDLGAREMSLIGLPSECISVFNVLLMVTEDGGLGIASVANYRLCLWSREAGTAPDKDAGWVQSGDIDLKPLFPDEESLDVVGFAYAYGVSVIFLRSRDGAFTIDLKSCQTKKAYNHGLCNYTVPYVSFCTPVLGAASTEGPRPGTSIAR